jgi:hypothetical protein
LSWIPNHGTKNDGYLARVLAEFRSMPYQTDFVLLSNLQKSHGNDVEVLTGTPTKNPHSLPFGHRKVFGERRDAYDLFVYTEDDILITVATPDRASRGLAARCAIPRELR